MGFSKSVSTGDTWSYYMSHTAYHHITPFPTASEDFSMRVGRVSRE